MRHVREHGQTTRLAEQASPDRSQSNLHLQHPDKRCRHPHLAVRNDDAANNGDTNDDNNGDNINDDSIDDIEVNDDARNITISNKIKL